MAGWDEGEDDGYPDDDYIPPYPFEAFLADTSLGKYADLSREDVHDDDVLWGDRGYFAPIEELFEERSPLDDPFTVSSVPGPFDPGYGLSVRMRWAHGVVPEAVTAAEAAEEPADVFGPGLCRHSWLWRTAETTLCSFADEPRRIGDTPSVIVAQAAENMLATGPTALPGLVGAAVSFRMGDADDVRRYAAQELETNLSGAAAKVEEPASQSDVVGRLLARALVRVDPDTLARDIDALAAELLFRNGEAPKALADRVGEILPTLGDVPADAVEPALDAAARLVKDGLVPVGLRDEGRTVAVAAGWLVLGAGLRCAPGSIAMLLCLQSAPRTLIRGRTRGLGPFGRYCAGDDEEVVAAWRSGGTVLVGVPGSGKTQLMFWLAAGAPGAVVAGTPNVLDVYEFAARATDHDCLVFDPGGLLGEGVPPGIKVVCLDLFSLVSDWSSAGTVAAQMVEAAGNHVGAKYEEFWRVKSAQLLRIYIFAAKSAGRPLTDALRWLEYNEEAELIGILARAGDELAANAFNAHLRLGEGNPRDSIVASALADLQAFVNLNDEGEALDFDRFVAGSGTLVLLADPTTSVACGAAAGMLTRQLIEARFRCFRQGRGGAPMLVLADEAARSPALSPILAEVLAVGPSRGVNIVAACQVLEQFDMAPGGSREITRAAARTLIFPESMPAELLQVAPYLEHDSAFGGDATELDPALLARPGNDTMHVLEGSRLRRMQPYAAHEMGLWRLCRLDAAFARAGAAPIAYW